MNNFKELITKIDEIIRSIKPLVKEKAISEAMPGLETANAHLLSMGKLAKSDIEKRFLANRIFAMECLSKEIDSILSKREAGKKEDGNIALKCNWNDNGFKAPCNQQAYDFNILQGRAWCSSLENKCRNFVGEATLGRNPCYESIALKEMRFGAGWDHTGDRKKPRRIHSVRQGRIAILTTRPPGVDETGRLIIGCLLINKVVDDPGLETLIFGDKEKSIEIDYDRIKINFWDYYKNAGDESLILWASGLFRYIADKTVLNILTGINEQYKKEGRDISRVRELIGQYEKPVAG